MKKYYVARIYESGVTPPSVGFMTDIYDDAFAYAGIMERAEGKKYTVLTLCESNEL